MNRFATRLLIFLTMACSASALLFLAQARASAPTGRYTVSGGTVLDTKTKLVWQQAVTPSAMTASSAATYCSGLGSTLGGTGWRVPTIKELLTLVDFTQDVHIDPTAFPNTSTTYYFWSSTPAIYPSSSAYVVLFSNGETSVEFTIRTDLVRCVR
jgi:Protein of unknown function (DUF1566)